MELEETEEGSQSRCGKGLAQGCQGQTQRRQGSLRDGRLKDEERGNFVYLRLHAPLVLTTLSGSRTEETRESQQEAETELILRATLEFTSPC